MLKVTMKETIDNFFEEKIHELPIFVKYTTLLDKKDKKRVIEIKAHNTATYFVKPFYKHIHPINLNEN